MCGIIGRINFSNKKINLDNVINANESLTHRGPDDSGVWNEKNVALAHRRLSIIDLTNTGKQPMISHNGRYVCVFNGEIYNFQEIKKEIENKVENWKGTSDTEVLLEAWSIWGTKTLEKIDGMFSFVIWDKKNYELFAARDRLGEKPFYYIVVL